MPANQITAGSAPMSPPELHPFARVVNPVLAQLLEDANLAKRFVRGEGCRLWDADGTEYLDFVGAYGALPFGFHHPQIVEAVEQFCRSMEPTFVQPSILDAAGELGRRLIDLAPPGLRHVTFTNSGAESIEVAIKLARSATGRLGIVATHNGFHGKTLGALSATGRPVYQTSFGAPVPGFVHVPYGDVEALEAVLAADAPQIAAFIVEPIQGEGGINVPPPGYLARAARLCRESGVLFICDEVQTGLGRTGAMFACESEGVRPDILTLAKALGGGMVPIGAVLSTADCYSEDFALKHTSTFAGNAMGCRIAIRSLDLLTANGHALVRHVATTGEYFRQRLSDLQARFPHLVTAVKGRGFLLGVELTDSMDAFERPSLLSSMAEQGSLALGFASYLLNVHHIRVAPTLFGARVMRIEPALVAEPAMADALVKAMEAGLTLLDRVDSAAFFGHFVGFDAVATAPASPARSRPTLRSMPSESRFGFVMHPLDLTSYVDMDHGLAAYRSDQLEALVARLGRCRLPELSQTLVVGKGRVTSADGASTEGEFLGVPKTAAELMEVSGTMARDLVAEAVQLAALRGARIVGLGGFTSIVTRNGLDLLDLDMPLTTGNSYTVAAGLNAVRAIMRRLDLAPAQTSVAVLGASGSIGCALATLLASQVGRVTLIARPTRTSDGRLAQVATAIAMHVAARGRVRDVQDGSVADMLLRRGAEAMNSSVAWLHSEGLVIRTTDAVSALRAADIVVTATSSVSGVVDATTLRPGAVVCDISRPFDVTEDVRAARPDVLVIDGGLIDLPGGLHHLDVSLGLPDGVVYACMAETILMALESRFQHGSIGNDLDPMSVLDLQERAERHGFALAPLMTSGRVIGDDDWVRVALHRGDRVPESLGSR